MSKTLTVGDIAPDFDLPGASGQRISLSELRGKKVAVYFYPKDDTSGCTKEAMEFNALRAEFNAANTEIVGISADSPTSHDKFKAKYNLDFALGSDEERTCLEAYGVWVEKSMYGRKYMGIERSTFLIDTEGRIAELWSKVKVPGHVQEVLSATQKL